jgi:hypothetical protein
MYFVRNTQCLLGFCQQASIPQAPLAVFRAQNLLSYALECAPSQFRATGDKTDAKRSDHPARALPKDTSEPCEISGLGVVPVSDDQNHPALSGIPLL